VIGWFVGPVVALSGAEPHSMPFIGVLVGRSQSGCCGAETDLEFVSHVCDKPTNM
jgi:hypothetical protein